MQEIANKISPLTDPFYPTRKLPSVRSEVVAVVKAALRASGAGSAVIDAFDLIADSTDRADWSLDGSPICYREQRDMAAELGLSDRHFRRIEAFLQDFGCLVRATADNGYRGRRRGHDGQSSTAGLSLKPAIENADVFRRAQREALARRKQLDRLRLDIRVQRRAIKELIADVDSADRKDWERHFDEVESQLPLTVRPHATESQLDALKQDLAELLSALQTAKHGVDNYRERTDPITNTVTKESGAPDMDGRCHIQPTTKPDVICSADAHGNRPAGKPAEATSVERTAVAVRIRIEDERVGANVPIKPEIARLLTPKRLFDMASEDLATYLNAYGDPIEAMRAYLAACGVNRSAWADAVAAMGEDVAFIGTLVLDRNRTHPSHPVVNLAGALRGLTAAARAGKLNLTRSIIGLWKREEDGSQRRPARGWKN